MNSTFIENQRPATLPEKGYSLSAREGRNWYLVERRGVIGITSELKQKDDVISTYTVPQEDYPLGLVRL